jgi:hypothetical protein
MENLDQLSQFVLKVLEDISYFINETFISGFLSKIVFHVIGFLKIIVEFIIIGLEAIVRILKFFVN